MSRTGTFDICKHQATSGSLALHNAVGVRKLGQQRLLSPAQESLVQKLIADKAPDQLKMPYALWSHAAVAELIKQRFGLKLKVHTMGMYLQRWGLTPQKPMRKAYEHLAAALKKWLDEDYPDIAQR
jgi:transposase